MRLLLNPGYPPFIKGHVLNTFPASRPATIEPAAIANAIKCRLAVPTFLILSMSVGLANFHVNSGAVLTNVNPFQRRRLKMIMAVLRCTNSL